MRAEPRSQQGPKPFHRVHVHFMKAITVVIPRVFPPAMTDTLMRITPLVQAAVDVVFICVHTRPRCNRGVDQRLERPLVDVFQHPNDHVTTALDHPEDRGLLRSECAASTLAFEPPAPSTPPFFSTTLGFPWWPATRYTSSHSTSSVHVGEGFLITMPWRN
jgi:hypothetical protein